MQLVILRKPVWLEDSSKGSYRRVRWTFDTGAKPRIQNIQGGGIWLRPDDDKLGVVVYIRVEVIDPSGNIFELLEEKDVD